MSSSLQDRPSNIGIDDFTSDEIRNAILGAETTLNPDTNEDRNRQHIIYTNITGTDVNMSGIPSAQQLIYQPPPVARAQPYLSIVEQPKARGLRFRYKCEGRSAGSIPGEHNTTEQRTYPTVRINDFNGQSAIIVVSCVTKEDPARPHPHSLVGRDCNRGVCTMKLKGTNTATFTNLGIQCTTKKDITIALGERKEIRVDPFQTGYTPSGNLDLNVVRLCFQAFLPDNKGKFNNVLKPIVSQCIYDKKAKNDLVICRLSKQAGRVSGGEEIILLCEKVMKDDITVRFFEESGDGIKWEAHGDFSPQDVHRQYAIVLKTPPYMDRDIKQPLSVYMQLKRPSDGETSDAKPFQYTPLDKDPEGIETKRRRKAHQIDQFATDNNAHLPSQRSGAKQEIRDRIFKKASRRREPKLDGTGTYGPYPPGTLPTSTWATLGPTKSEPTETVSRAPVSQPGDDAQFTELLTSSQVPLATGSQNGAQMLANWTGNPDPNDVVSQALLLTTSGELTEDFITTYLQQDPSSTDFFLPEVMEGISSADIPSQLLGEVAANIQIENTDGDENNPNHQHPDPAP